MGATATVILATDTATAMVTTASTARDPLMPSPDTDTMATDMDTATDTATVTATVTMATTARDLLMPSLGTGTTVAAMAMDTATAMAMATDTATATTDKQQTKDYVGIVGRVQFE